MSKIFWKHGLNWLSGRILPKQLPTVKVAKCISSPINLPAQQPYMHFDSGEALYNYLYNVINSHHTYGTTTSWFIDLSNSLFQYEATISPKKSIILHELTSKNISVSVKQDKYRLVYKRAIIEDLYNTSQRFVFTANLEKIDETPRQEKETNTEESHCTSYNNFVRKVQNKLGKFSMCVFNSLPIGTNGKLYQFRVKYAAFQDVPRFDLNELKTIDLDGKKHNIEIKDWKNGGILYDCVFEFVPVS